MKLPPFKARIQQIKKIDKSNGKTMIYLFVTRDAIYNELYVEIEPQKTFLVIVDHSKTYMLNNFSHGDLILISVYLNSKETKDKNANDYFLLSMRLCQISHIINP